MFTDQPFSRRNLLTLALAGGASGLVSAGRVGRLAPSSPKLLAEPWPEAEAMFKKDPKWIGGDSAYSIDLGGGRVLWLFGDSFIANTAARSRSDSVMVRNCIAIQTGYDPTTASMKYHWNETGTRPSSFFGAPTASTWYWPGDGVRIGSRLILFLNELKAVSNGLGFEGVGWTAVAIENPQADPSKWVVTKLKTEQQFGVTLGAGSLVDRGYLYAFSAGLLNQVPTYLARWPISAIAANTLTGTEWFAGRRGWLTADKINAPTAVASVLQSEFTVFPTKTPAPFVLIQTSGFGGATLAYETAHSLSGPYSGAQTFYLPPERTEPKIMIYSAKMHPEQSAPGFDVVATYCTNSLNFPTLVKDMSLYFPRFVRAKWTK